jgi:hypothetical protein
VPAARSTALICVAAPLLACNPSDGAASSAAVSAAPVVAASALPPPSSSAAVLPSSPPPPLPPSPIRYRVVSQGGPGSETFSVLAKRNGSTFKVEGARFNCCLSVLTQKDLDGDGLIDAILEEGTGGTGAYGDPMYYFVAGTMGDVFLAQEVGNGEGKLAPWHGKSSLVLDTDNEGVNTDRPERGILRFAFENGHAVLVEEKHAVEIKALADLRSEQFDAVSNQDEEKSLFFDLDGDGKKDELVGRLWFRWGRFYWRVRFGDGRTTEEDDSSTCKRLGVLAQKTQGHHELVCDFDTRFRWNGIAYEAVSKKAR